MLTENVLTGVPYMDYDDYNHGRMVLSYFHNKMCDLYRSNYGISFQQLVDILRSRKGQKLFLEQLGLQYEVTEMTPKTAQASMEYLAVKCNGQLPTNNSAFTIAIQQQLDSEFNFGDITSFVAIQTAKDIYNETERQAGVVLKIVEKTGEKTGDILGAAADSTTSILSSAKWIIPVILIGGVFLYVYLMPKRG